MIELSGADVRRGSFPRFHRVGDTWYVLCAQPTSALGAVLDVHKAHGGLARVRVGGVLAARRRHYHRPGMEPRVVLYVLRSILEIIG